MALFSHSNIINITLFCILFFIAIFIDNNLLLATDAFQLNCPTSGHTITTARNSNLNFEYLCTLNGLFDGNMIELHPTGSIAKKGHYTKGAMSGRWERFFINGIKSDSGIWLNDRPIGLWTFWYENGQKKEEGNFKDGEKDGEWIYWNEEGLFQSRGEYRFGDIVRQHTLTLSWRNLSEEIKYTDINKKTAKLFSKISSVAEIDLQQKVAPHCTTHLQLRLKYLTLANSAEVDLLQTQPLRGGVTLGASYQYGDNIFSSNFMLDETIFATSEANSTLSTHSALIPGGSLEWAYLFWKNSRYATSSFFQLGLLFKSEIDQEWSVSSSPMFLVGAQIDRTINLRSNILLKSYYQESSQTIRQKEDSITSEYPQQTKRLALEISYRWNF